MAASSMLDPTQIALLRELDEDGDDTFFRQLIEEFLEQSQRLVAEIGRAIAEGEYDRLRFASHSLKGSSLNLGAMLQGEVCLQIEEAVKRQDLGALPPLHGHLCEVHAQTAHSLGALLSETTHSASTARQDGLRGL